MINLILDFPQMVLDLISINEINTVLNEMTIQNRKCKVECRATQTHDKSEDRRSKHLLLTGHTRPVPLVKIRYTGLPVLKANIETPCRR
jgi:hypothetical protein